MIDAAISARHLENVQRLTQIESRIIGIDGNGTGRIGALQKLELKVDKVCTDVETLVHRSTSIPKKVIFTALGAIGLTFVSVVGSLFADYVRHALNWK